ncbi:integrase domain-containing protein [Paraburkholderia terrae]|uniref:integrase domain-containing protein n=1 Tax=Paraburkholderia terrae TaxID=311230 RepID=UPI00204E98D2|nr:integrase domain-containing protein [Paraburkholderia terrae]BDC39155.1 DNA-binding protein [Paraburkholderia terrae]
MSYRSRLRHAASQHTLFRGGSEQTQRNRLQLCGPLWDFLILYGIKVAHIRDTPLWAIDLFIQTRLAEGMKPGHARNTTSAIRVLLHEAGCGTVNTACSNAALGVPRRDRGGARRAYTTGEFALTIERAHLVDEGLAHLISLMYYLGLRSIEALRCVRYLADWLALLEAGASELQFEHGAKTNRPRRIEIVDPLRAETLRAIRSALAYCNAHNGWLISGRKNKTLKSARHRLRTTLRAAGLMGRLSSHALRYAYAVNLALSLLKKNVSPEETLDRVSASLGHGPRAQMILNTYLGEIRERFASVVIPRSKPRNPARTRRERHLPGPLRATRSNRSMQFRRKH